MRNEIRSLVDGIESFDPNRPGGSRNSEHWEHAAPMVWPPPLTDRQMKKAAEATLPGAAFRRHLHGRHSIIWTKPT